MVGLMRIVNGVGMPSRSRKAVRLADAAKHGVDDEALDEAVARIAGSAARRRGLAMFSAGWSSMILSRTNWISPLWFSGVSFSARLKALTILALSSLVASFRI